MAMAEEQPPTVRRGPGLGLDDDEDDKDALNKFKVAVAEAAAEIHVNNLKLYLAHDLVRKNNFQIVKSF